MAKPKKRGVKPGTKRGDFGNKIALDRYNMAFMKVTEPQILTLCDQLEETVTRLENKISNSIARINSLI